MTTQVLVLVYQGSRLMVRKRIFRLSINLLDKYHWCRTEGDIPNVSCYTAVIEYLNHCLHELRLLHLISGLGYHVGAILLLKKEALSSVG